MGKFLLNVIAGARQALVLMPDDDYVRPVRGDFHRDAKVLREDAKRVARGLRKTTLKHVESLNNR